MSGNFEVLKDFNLIEESEAEKAQQNVGWGKKETQFHGSEGKSAALNSKQESLQYAELDQPVVTWRADDALFAVSYWDDRCNMRKVKVFKRDGTLQNISEYLPGLVTFLKPIVTHLTKKIKENKLA